LERKRRVLLAKVNTKYEKKMEVNQKRKHDMQQLHAIYLRKLVRILLPSSFFLLFFLFLLFLL